MKAYTYFQPLAKSGNWNESEQRELIRLWSQSWRKHGWDPVVLNESTTSVHPRFAELKQKFWSLPTEYGHDYEGSCMLRYAAVASQKQRLSLMLDYDVINYGFTPQDAVAAMKKYPDPRLIFFAPGGLHHCGMTLGPWELFEGYAAILAEWTPGPADWNKSSTYEGYHCSDNSMLVGMFKGTHPKPAWLVMDHSGPNHVWSRPGWEKSKTVHYGYEMHHAGHWPKWKHINKLRPI